ncbi:unnamed protein product [Vicia faba]|uniref:Uncharacterized protein n=1 Tax=Vicia faba TaxID=3906 RepID=A0AAV0Z359_VICFA|nr:unnamed protein product [Vicia faba]
MGNCCTSSTMEWAGDDWGSLTSKHNPRMNSSKVFDEVHGMSLDKKEKEKLLGALRASSDANGKVKIKISKKELAVLLGEKKNQGGGGTGHASAEQVLVGLLNARDHVNHDVLHHRTWKPVLKSIPEVN